MATKLTRIKLLELSLVDSPANEHALVCIIKRAPEPIHFPAIGDPTAIAKALAAQKAEIDAQSAALAKLNGTHEEEQQRKVEKMAQDFPRVVSEIQKRDSCSRVEAWAKAAREAPEACEAYRASGAMQVDKRSHGVPVGLAAAKTTFMAKVSQIQGRDKCTRVDAMQKARIEHPTEYEAYQTGDPIGTPNR